MSDEALKATRSNLPVGPFNLVIEADPPVLPPHASRESEFVNPILSDRFSSGFFFHLLRHPSGSWRSLSHRSFYLPAAVIHQPLAELRDKTLFLFNEHEVKIIEAEAKRNSGKTPKDSRNGFYAMDRGLKTSSFYASDTRFGYIDERIKIRLQRLSNNRPIRILTIGAGFGNMEAEIKTTFGDRVEIDTFSLTPQILDENRPHIGTEYLGNIDYSQLPHGPDGKGYDLIISIYGASYTMDSVFAFQQIYDALAPGGEAFFQQRKLTTVVLKYVDLRGSLALPYLQTEYGLFIQMRFDDSNYASVYLEKIGDNPFNFRDFVSMEAEDYTLRADTKGEPVYYIQETRGKPWRSIAETKLKNEIVLIAQKLGIPANSSGIKDFVLNVIHVIKHEDLPLDEAVNKALHNLSADLNLAFLQSDEFQNFLQINSFTSHLIYRAVHIHIDPVTKIATRASSKQDGDLILLFRRDGMLAVEPNHDSVTYDLLNTWENIARIYNANPRRSSETFIRGPVPAERQAIEPSVRRDPVDPEGLHYLTPGTRYSSPYVNEDFKQPFHFITDSDDIFRSSSTTPVLAQSPLPIELEPNDYKLVHVPNEGITFRDGNNYYLVLKIVGNHGLIVRQIKDGVEDKIIEEKTIAQYNEDPTKMGRLAFAHLGDRNVLVRMSHQGISTIAQSPNQGELVNRSETLSSERPRWNAPNIRRTFASMTTPNASTFSIRPTAVPNVATRYLNAVNRPIFLSRSPLALFR